MQLWLSHRSWLHVHHRVNGNAAIDSKGERNRKTLRSTALEDWVWIPFYGQFPFENNLKRTINCPVTRRGKTGVIIAVWRTLRNSGQVLMRTSHPLLRKWHHTHWATIMSTNGNSSEASLEPWHSVSIIVAYRTLYVVILHIYQCVYTFAVCITSFAFL